MGFKGLILAGALALAATASLSDTKSKYMTFPDTDELMALAWTDRPLFCDKMAAMMVDLMTLREKGVTQGQLAEDIVETFDDNTIEQEVYLELLQILYHDVPEGMAPRTVGVLYKIACMNADY